MLILNINGQETLLKNYIIAIEESFVTEFSIYAEDFGEALELAEQKYNSGTFVVPRKDVAHKQMATMAPEGEETEWILF